jgi:antitoxin CptB
MTNRSRLLWRCCRRGTREMDTLFGRFLELEYDGLDAGQQLLFERLLDEPDPDIYAWILGNAQPANPEYRFLIQRLQGIHLL